MSSLYVQSQHAISSFRSNAPLGLSEGVTSLFASSESDHHTLAIGLALLAGLNPPKWAGLLKGAATRTKRLGSEPGIYM